MQKIIMHLTILVTTCIIAFSVRAQAAQTAAPPATGKMEQTGRWTTESGNLEVDIAPCGPALCGTVVKVIANKSMSNPGAAMAAADTRSPIGMKILHGFKPSGDNEWTGRIYNRENGETYDCQMALLAPDQLKIRGYKVLPLFGKTQVWRRVSDQPARTAP